MKTSLAPMWVYVLGQFFLSFAAALTIASTWQGCLIAFCSAAANALLAGVAKWDHNDAPPNGGSTPATGTLPPKS